MVGRRVGLGDGDCVSERERERKERENIKKNGIMIRL